MMPSKTYCLSTQYLTALQLSEFFGVEKATLYQRLRRGAPTEAAISKQRYMQWSRQQRRKESGIKRCQHCNNAFQPLNRRNKYCSESCQISGYRESFKSSFSCVSCGSVFNGYAKNTRSNFCRACQAKSVSELGVRVRKLKAAVKIWEPPNQPQYPWVKAKWKYHSAKAYIGFLLDSDNYSLIPRHFACGNCGRLHLPQSKRQNSCSALCRREIKRKTNHKARNKARKAGKTRDRGKVRKRMRNAGTSIIEGVTYQSGINRLSVAKRDGWRCQQCGVKVVKDWEDDGDNGHAATVGHWPVPIANGGTHTWDNVQCQCFSCNRKLGARFISIKDYTAGQLGLGM